MASIDTIESAHREEMYGTNKKQMLERPKGLVPTISINDLVIVGKEKRMDCCIVTYYKPISSLQIWKEDCIATKITKRREESKKRTFGKNIGPDSKASENQKEQTVAINISVTKHNIPFYYVRILGASVTDILRYIRGDAKSHRKFTGEDRCPPSQARVKKALSLLQKEQSLIKGAYLTLMKEKWDGP
jgi:hypothetical protein